MTFYKADAPYILTDGIFSLAGGGDDRVCFIFVSNAVIWWAFRGVILCYPLTTLYLYGKISISLFACTTILVLQSLMVTLIFFQVMGDCAGLICLYRPIVDDSFEKLLVSGKRTPMGSRGSLLRLAGRELRKEQV